MATSCPRIAGKIPFGPATGSVNASVRHTLLAFTSTKTSLYRGSLASTEVTSSGFPVPTATAALTSIN